MRGKWSQPGVPHKGWLCAHVEDLGSPIETCGMCESQAIRYVHWMQHPDYPDEIGAGCICAGHMEEDHKAAKDRERRVKNEARRRQRKRSRSAWKTSRNGNPYINTDGYNVVLYPAGDRWGCRITDITTGAKFGVKIRRKTLDEVKDQALVVLENLKKNR